MGLLKQADDINELNTTNTEHSVIDTNIPSNIVESSENAMDDHTISNAAISMLGTAIHDNTMIVLQLLVKQLVKVLWLMTLLLITLQLILKEVL